MKPPATLKLELKVERLKDEFAELRKKFAGWQQSVTQTQSLLKRRTALSLATVLIVLVLLVIGGRALFSRVAPIDEKRIRSGFVKTIGETYQKQLLAAEELTEWEKRDVAKKTAAETRERRLGTVTVTDEMDQAVAVIDLVAQHLPQVTRLGPENVLPDRVVTQPR